jgi:hypothetical protein
MCHSAVVGELSELSELSELCVLLGEVVQQEVERVLLEETNHI